MPCQQCVAITGAGSGIGAEIARIYSLRGARLALSGRNGERLASVALRCVELGAKARWDQVDVRDSSAVQAWVNEIDELSPIDIMIVNAGIFAGRPDVTEHEPPEIAQDVIATNLVGAMNSAEAVARRMVTRRNGRIVLVSSLAATFPSPDAKAYSASKAGLSAYGEALRAELLSVGVGVTLVHPGHVATFQADQQQGPLPFLITAEQAARQVVHAIDTGRAEISFPWRASIGVRLTRLLPWRIRAKLAGSSRFTVRNPESYRRPDDDLPGEE